MNSRPKPLAARILAYALCSLIAVEPAFAQVTISTTPLATSGGASILANLMFILDDSGSMDSDFNPDYVDDSRQCGYSVVSGNVGSSCKRGDPPYDAGGANGYNGVAYDPLVNYKAALNHDGTVKNNPTDLANVKNDAYNVQSTNSINIETGVRDLQYCTQSGGLGSCRRNGASADGTTLVGGTDVNNVTYAAGRFPYRQAGPSNASVGQFFSLPETPPVGRFVRSGSTVTVTTLTDHGLAAGDHIFVQGTGVGSIDGTDRTVASVTNSTTFTFTSSSSGSQDQNGSFRKHSAGSFSRANSTVTVSATAHGLVTGDSITILHSNSNIANTDEAVTVVNADSFTYERSGNTTVAASAGTWYRQPYQYRHEVNGAPPTYSIIPVEYCTDANLTDCVAATSASSSYPVPAYVRFCQRQDQAMAFAAIGDSSGTPRCRAKFVNSGTTTWRWARYGNFQRATIRSDAAPFVRASARSDCAAAPNCTYAEEIANYARWYTYYRTRMQMMKTASGRAFQTFISDPPTTVDKLRVGFITINPYKANDGTSSSVTSPATKYLKIAPFTKTHAQDWYTKFYAQKPGPFTPLREALTRVGWIYAGKLNTGLTNNIPLADDPVEAACQRNFALLTTDGYWNGENGQDLSADDIGNHDNVNPTTDTPYTSPAVDRATTGTFDGGTGTVVTTTTPTVQVEEVTCYGGLQTTFSGSDQTACGCGVRQKRVKRRTLTQTQTISTTDGAETQNEIIPSVAFSDVTSCVDGNWQELTQYKQVRTVQRCRDTSSGGAGNSRPANFWDGNSETCSSCSSDRYVLIEQRRRGRVVTTKVDGVTTNVSSLQTATGGSGSYTGTPVYRFSLSNDTESSSNWKSSISQLSNTSCSSSAMNPSGAATPVQTDSGAESVTASGAAGTYSPAYTAINPNPSVPAVGTANTTTVPGGYANTLADVAMYYFRTDLRGGKDPNGNLAGPADNHATIPVDVGSNVVPAKAGAKNYATHQHMVTFALGMVDGLMRYQSDYETATSGDFFNIRQGTNNACFWVTGTCNWPQPVSGGASALDDLWHAAVNGRGQYFQARDVEAMEAGLAGTLNAVNAQVAAAAASATSSPNITQTNNQIFSTTYETITWSGKVFAQTIDPNTGNVNAAIQWNADTQLVGPSGDCSAAGHGKACTTGDSRRIWTFDGASSTKVKEFLWASLDTTEQGYFTDVCEGSTPWSQCSGAGALTGTPRSTANNGTALLSYLRGHSTNEGPIFRDRTFIDPSTNAVIHTVLGDTISAKPAYVREATFNFGGGYPAFASAKATRAPRVYVGANDGYMHAFDGDTGQEAWAYTPRFLMDKLYQLADKSYTSSTVHQYYVDGSPETADVCVNTTCSNAADWRTILVAGVNAGGRGYYALDISSMDTTTPGDDVKALWEFCNDATVCARSDADLGLTFGNAVMGKRTDGRSIVVVTSGLNNHTTGDGKGYFYVLDAITGEILHKVPTGAGSASVPSGLMKISAFYDNAFTDPTFRYVYGGDQLGNVWRLDLNPGASNLIGLDSPGPLPPNVVPAPFNVADIPTGYPQVIKIAELKDGDGRLQPITTRPALTHIGSKNVLYVGTGRYLGNPDLEDQGAGESAWQHSLYAFIDCGTACPTGSLRSDANMKARTLTSISPTERGVAELPADGTLDVDWTLPSGGWYIDFNPTFGGVEQSPGEGVNIVDPRLVLGTLVVTTNAPSAGGTCAVGGTSYFYNFDFKTGDPVSTSPNGVVGVSLGGTITVGVAVVQLPSGAIKAISTGADTSKTTSGVSIGASGSSVKRFSYRVR
jgi:type IV pilus assembly protein PilY1